jgi:hypothetical protein
MAKTKAQITGIKESGDKLRQFLQSAIKDKDVLEELGTFSSSEIKKRTTARLEEYKQPDIEETTIKRRKSLIEQGNKSEFARANRSNLTLSGQLLDAIKYRINQSKALITIFLSDERRPYKGKSGQDLEAKSNNQIKKDLEAIGRKFLFISERLKTQLESKLKLSIQKKLSNFKRIKRSLK